MFDRYRMRADGDGPSLLDVKTGGKGKGSKDGAKGGVSKKRVNKIVNNAIANLVKGSQLSDAVKSVMAPLLKDLKPGATDKTTTTPTEPQPTDVKGLSPEANAIIHELQRQNKELKSQVTGLADDSKAKEARAQKAETDSAIETALNDYTFTSPGARETAKRLIAMEVTRTEDGKLLGGGDLPLTDFVKEALTTKHDYFLASAEVGGAGASKGITRNSAGVGLETIKRDMTEADRQAVTAEIGRAIQAAQTQF